ncbi:7606_t:CDS:1, partial [Racocetra fulgida]
VSEKNIDIFFEDVDENNTNNDEVYEQIEAVSIEEEKFSIIEKFSTLRHL